MVYYTYSQGFRPGGFNQNGGTLHAYGTDGVAQYALPRAYLSDDLTNNEIGWKTEFLDHRLQWNGAVYQENWDNVQVAFFDPGLVGNIFYNTNGQNFRIRGIETSLVARVTNGLTVQGAAAWNQSEQTNSPALIANNPLSGNTASRSRKTANWTTTAPPSSPATRSPIPSAPSVRRAPMHRRFSSPCVLATSGQSTDLRLSSRRAGRTRDIPTRRRVQILRSRRPGSITTGRLRFENPAYTTFDASFGVSKGRLVCNRVRREPQQFERQHLCQHATSSSSRRRRCGRESSASPSGASSDNALSNHDHPSAVELEVLRVRDLVQERRYAQGLQRH